MSGERPLRLAIVAGEESGDLLGADLVAALKALNGRDVELCGVGGEHLEAHGLKSLFDGSEIALMGIAAVLRDLPRLVWRIRQTADAVARFEPDCLVTIDSPAFGLRVARRVRAMTPNIPIIHYVCPSVWAWGPWRARKMRPHVDHVLCLLPFEPAELERLGGPAGTFVGHRLARDPRLLATAEMQAGRKPGERKVLLVLPGSRRSEIRTLLTPFGETISILRDRGHDFEILLPTLSRLAKEVEEAVRQWPVPVDIVTGEEAKYAAFARADAALAASGTVLLELALAGVPAVSAYRMDRLWRAMSRLITVWSAALPNLIADRFVVPEYIDEMVRPGMMARVLEQLWSETEFRALQLEGYDMVRRRLTTDRPSGEIAAEQVLSQVGEQVSAGS